jgi:hypothetical protein
MFTATRFMAIIMLCGIGLCSGVSRADTTPSSALAESLPLSAVQVRDSDIGLVILAADSEATARAMLDADPSIAAGTFAYDVHPFSVLYPGTVRSPTAR